MKTGFVLLVVCAFAVAMVPRERRAVNSEELSTAAAPPSSTPVPSTTPKRYCAPQTPCGWFTYKPGVRIIEMNITNSYCVCSPDTTCQSAEDDTTVNVIVHKCRPPPAEETENEEEES